MAMGKQSEDGQGDLWIATTALPKTWSTRFFSAVRISTNCRLLATNALILRALSLILLLTVGFIVDAYLAIMYASILSVFAICPTALAKSLTRFGFTMATGN